MESRKERSTENPEVYTWRPGPHTTICLSPTQATLHGIPTAGWPQRIPDPLTGGPQANAIRHPLVGGRPHQGGQAGAHLRRPFDPSGPFTRHVDLRAGTSPSPPPGGDVSAHRRPRDNTPPARLPHGRITHTPRTTCVAPTTGPGLRVAPHVTRR